MASNAFWAYGSTFQIGDGETSEVFTDVAEVIDIDGPGLSKDSIEVTNQDSSDGYREFLPGWRDGDTITVSMNWLPNDATQDDSTGLLSHYNDNDNHNYRIVLPSAVGITIKLTGHPTSFPPSLPMEEQGQIELEIKLSGKPTIS
ncbi:MAG: phage tail tube protein [Chloroflexota bacterium]|nr:phage tail tube protein [Chloroflexota bacterium]